MVEGIWSDLAESLPPVIRRYRSRISSLQVREKADRTLLTEADLEVEALIIEAIRRRDPGASIVAEESGSNPGSGGQSSGSSRVWVIDPIDGTAEFVRPERREFCSVVCRLEEGLPQEAFVLAPELGRERAPLTFMVDAKAKRVTVNGAQVGPGTGEHKSRWISVTRSKESASRPFEAEFEGMGFSLKLRTTSQTLDMLRTAVDISALTELHPTAFSLFFREQQKVWDGVAGLCASLAMGLTIVDACGVSPFPISHEFLSGDSPTFDSTIVGTSEVVRCLLGRL